MTKIKTKMIDLNNNNDKEEAIKEAGKALLLGDTVAFPTETVYGLGGNAMMASAIEKIYKAKGRPSDNPLIVHISDFSMLESIAESILPYAYDLMRAFWPGPITFVFKKKAGVPDITTGGLDTVAVRMPDHPVALKLIKYAGVPIAAPSANLSGKPSPTSGAHVVEDLMHKVDYIISDGDTKVGLESTVVDLSGDLPIVLRPGAITDEMINAILVENKYDIIVRQTDDAVDNDEETENIPRSPGMKYKHYAPEAEVWAYTGSSNDIMALFREIILNKIENKENSSCKIGLMIFTEDWEILNPLISEINNVSLADDNLFICLEGSINTSEFFAHQLFHDLRECDRQGCEQILIHAPHTGDMSRAILNRLNKAAEGRVIRI